MLWKNKPLLSLPANCDTLYVADDIRGA